VKEKNRTKTTTDKKKLKLLTISNKMNSNQTLLKNYTLKSAKEGARPSK
jgi:hypothetical protein